MLRELSQTFETVLIALLAGIIFGSLFTGCGASEPCEQSPIAVASCTEGELRAMPPMDYCHDASGTLGLSSGFPCLAPVDELPAGSYAFRECPATVHPGPDYIKGQFTNDAMAMFTHSCDECFYPTPGLSQ